MRRKRNPTLVIFNPPKNMRHRVVGEIAEEVQRIEYYDSTKEQKEGSGNWFHNFGNAKAVAVQRPDGTRDILIVSTDGKPLWFDDDHEDAGDYE